MDVMLNQPPPCESFNCKLYEKCKTNLLACESFKHYVDTGHSVDPRATWVGRNMKSRKIELGRAVYPTHRQYYFIMGDMSEIVSDWLSKSTMRVLNKIISQGIHSISDDFSGDNAAHAACYALEFERQAGLMLKKRLVKQKKNVDSVK